MLLNKSVFLDNLIFHNASSESECPSSEPPLFIERVLITTTEVTTSSSSPVEDEKKLFSLSDVDFNSDSDHKV